MEGSFGEPVPMFGILPDISQATVPSPPEEEKVGGITSTPQSCRKTIPELELANKHRDPNPARDVGAKQRRVIEQASIVLKPGVPGDVDGAAALTNHARRLRQSYRDRRSPESLPHTAGRLRRAVAALSSWPAQAGHPRLLPISAPPGVDGGPAAAMTMKARRRPLPTYLRFAVASMRT